jgi:hypothetical protein
MAIMTESSAKGSLVGEAMFENQRQHGNSTITASDDAHTYTTHTHILDPDDPVGFRLELPAGTYLVKAVTEDRLHTAEQANVVIHPNAKTRVRLIFDPQPPA